MSFFVHEQGICETTSVGHGTRIWAFAHVLPGAVIGEDCNICDHVFIENDVVIGNRVTVKCGVQLWDGIQVQNDVFIGPNATFTNDKFPRSKVYQKGTPPTCLEHHCSIGANAVLLPGIRIGAHAVVGAGAVVTQNVPPYAIVVGNPARITGYTQTKSYGGATLTIPGEKIEQDIEPLSIPGAKLYRFPQFDDLRGNLTVADMERHFPFKPKRYFVVYGVSDQRIRGEHAHRQCEQFLSCVAGSIHLVLDDGQQREEIVLTSPHVGLYVPPMIWATQYRFTSSASLLVFASHAYDNDDYIRDYEQYMTLRQSR